MTNDDSRSLDGTETTVTLTLREVMQQYEERGLAVVHGDRCTPVHGYARVEDGYLGTYTEQHYGKSVQQYFLKDCYGQEIPTTYASAEATVDVIYH